MPSDHQKPTTAHCSTRGHFKSGATKFKEDLKINTKLTKPDSDSSWQHLLCSYLRQLLGFTVCWMQHLYRQTHITFWFTLIICWGQYKWHRYSVSKERGLEGRTDENLLWHYSLAMPPHCLKYVPPLVPIQHFDHPATDTRICNFFGDSNSFIARSS